MNPKRLHIALEAAGIPIHGVSNSDGVATVQFRDEATAQQRADAAAIVSGFDNSAPADAAWQRDRERAQAAARLLNGSADGKLFRAVLLMVLDEFNLHAAKTNAILSAIDASTNYATLKTNIAAVADYPTRSAAQLRTAIDNKLSSGAADS